MASDSAIDAAGTRGFGRTEMRGPGSAADQAQAAAGTTRSGMPAADVDAPWAVAAGGRTITARFTVRNGATIACSKESAKQRHATPLARIFGGTRRQCPGGGRERAPQTPTCQYSWPIRKPRDDPSQPQARPLGQTSRRSPDLWHGSSKGKLQPCSWLLRRGRVEVRGRCALHQFSDVPLVDGKPCLPRPPNIAACGETVVGDRIRNQPRTSSRLRGASFRPPSSGPFQASGPAATILRGYRAAPHFLRYNWHRRETLRAIRKFSLTTSATLKRGSGEVPGAVGPNVPAGEEVRAGARRCLALASPPALPHFNSSPGVIRLVGPTKPAARPPLPSGSRSSPEARRGKGPLCHPRQVAIRLTARHLVAWSVLPRPAFAAARAQRHSFGASNRVSRQTSQPI